MYSRPPLCSPIRAPTIGGAHERMLRQRQESANRTLVDRPEHDEVVAFAHRVDDLVELVDPNVGAARCDDRRNARQRWATRKHPVRDPLLRKIAARLRQEESGILDVRQPRHLRDDALERRDRRCRRERSAGVQKCAARQRHGTTMRVRVCADVPYALPKISPSASR